MRNFFKRAKNTLVGAATFVKEKACGFIARAREKFRMRTARARVMLAANRAENFVDSGIKILIAALSVVCGLWGSLALLLFAQIAMLVFYAGKYILCKINGKTAEKSLPFVPFIFIGYIVSAILT